MNIKPVYSWRSIKYALFTPSNRSLMAGLAFAFCAGLAFIYWGYALVGVVTALATLGGACALGSASVLEYTVSDMLGKRALLEHWALEADTEEEQASRKARVALMDADDMDFALRDLGMTYRGPMLNTDGTMMLPGNSNIDIHGNVYGASDIVTTTFDSDTGLWTDPNGAYEQPTGYTSSEIYGSDSYRCH